MLILKSLTRLYKDNRGQQATESLVILAVLAVALAAALFVILPSLGQGFMGMTKAIAGPTP